MENLNSSTVNTIHTNSSPCATNKSHNNSLTINNSNEKNSANSKFLQRQNSILKERKIAENNKKSLLNTSLASSIRNPTNNNKGWFF